MDYVYVVICAFGEYEQRSEILGGAFATVEDAHAALVDAKARSGPQWEIYQAWEARKTAYLETLTPDRILDGPPFSRPFKCYGNEAYAAAEKAAGPKPFIIVTPDEEYIYRVPFGRWADEPELVYEKR